MPSHHFLDVITDMYPSHIDRAILPHKASHTTHVISIIRVLVPAKNIHIWIKHIMDAWQSVQIFALLTLRTYSPRKEKAEIASRHLVRLRISRILRDVAAPGSSSLRQVLVLTVAARPLIVPDIEYCASLRRGLGFHGRGVDLWSRWALLLSDDLLNFSLGGRCHLIAGRRERCRGFFPFHIMGSHRGRCCFFDVSHFVGCRKDDLLMKIEVKSLVRLRSSSATPEWR